MKRKYLLLIIILFMCLFLFSTPSLALIPGDFGSAGGGPPDGVVDFEDLMIFAMAYGSTPASPNWNPLCDITSQGSTTPDGVIDFEDLMIFAMHYGEGEGEVTHLEDSTGSDGVATFVLEDGREVQVKVIDVVTGEPIPNIDSYLVTDGTDVAFLFIDSAGNYLPRIAPEEQNLQTLARPHKERQVGTIQELWGFGQAHSSGYQPQYADQIKAPLLSYMFRTFFIFWRPSTLGELESNLGEFLIENYLGIDAGLGVVIGAFIPGAQEVLVVLAAVEFGNTAAYLAWVYLYTARGYSLDQHFEIWRLNSIFAGAASVIPWVFPIEPPSGSVIEENPGSISGKVLDARTSLGIPNAQVQIVDLDLSTTTSSDGSYSFNSVPPGTYGVVATKAGYYPSVQINVTVISEATAVDVNLVLSSILASTEYRIVLTWGENPRDLDSHLWTPPIEESSDPRIDQAINWAFDQLESEDYKEECLRFVQEAYWYGADAAMPTYGYAKNAADVTRAAQNKSNPIPRGALIFFDWYGTVEGVYRNWGHVGIALGNDEMIHAYVTVKTGSIEDFISDSFPYIGWAWPEVTPPIEGYHIAYYSMGDLDSPPYAALDVDDITSYGPETVTIAQFFPGTYTYAVHHYCYWWDDQGAITTSNAVVKVYDEFGLLRTFYVPSGYSESCWWWKVFELDGETGAITSINTISAETPRRLDVRVLPLKRE